MGYGALTQEWIASGEHARRSCTDAITECVRLGLADALSSPTEFASRGWQRAAHLTYADLVQPTGPRSAGIGDEHSAITRIASLGDQVKGPVHGDDPRDPINATRDQHREAIRLWESVTSSQRIHPRYARILWEHIALLPGDEDPVWTVHQVASWATALLFSLRNGPSGEDRHLRDCPRAVILSACGIASARVLLQHISGEDRPDVRAAREAASEARLLHRTLSLRSLRQDLPRIDNACVNHRTFRHNDTTGTRRCSSAREDS